jgi:nucleoside-diphosphate-sugar epimerase
LGTILDKVEVFLGDVRNYETVSSFVNGADCVCHLAYVNGTENFYNKPDLVLDVAVRGMLNILDACREHSVKEFLLTSSSEAYQTPPITPTPEDIPLSVPDVLNPRYSYGGGKIINELMLINRARTEFDKAIIVRPHNVYGPDMGTGHVVSQFILRMLKLFKEQPEGVVDFPIQGTGEETRAFAYINDLVDGIKCALDHGEHLNIYHVGNDKEIPLENLAHLLARLLGRKINLIKGPLQPGSTLRRCPDISKLRKLGYEPKVSLWDGLQRTIDWYRCESLTLVNHTKE